MKVPFVSKSASSKGVALSHFLEFADIDRDGNEEIYFTVTSPFEGIGGAEFADGTAYRADFTGTEWVLSDIGVPGTAYARRLKTVRTGAGDQLLAVYEGKLDAEGKTVTPVRLYRYSQKSGVPAWDVALELPGHRECKTLTNFRTGESALQIGCDGAVLYEVKMGASAYSVVRTLRFSPDADGPGKPTDETGLLPWETRSIHAVEGGDWNGDGLDELVI